MEDNNLTDTARAIAYSLISTIQRRTTFSDQHLGKARRRINQLSRMVHAREAEIHCIRNSNGNPKMPPDFE